MTWPQQLGPFAYLYLHALTKSSNAGWQKNTSDGMMSLTAFSPGVCFTISVPIYVQPRHSLPLPIYLVVGESDIWTVELYLDGQLCATKVELKFSILSYSSNFFGFYITKDFDGTIRNSKSLQD